MQAKLFKLEWKDLLKGLFLTVITSVLTIILQTVQVGSLTFDWKTIGTTALTVGIAYLIKQFTSNSEGIPLTKEK